MTLPDLIANPEFWSALAGAMAAFLLGVFATWRVSVRANRTAGNMALLTLSQMYSLLETIHRQYFVKEAKRATQILGRPPFEFELRPIAGISDHKMRLATETLGFLAESHDPDVLNGLLIAERAFASILEVVRRHETLHVEMQARFAARGGGQGLVVRPNDIPALIGMDLTLQLVTIVRDLQAGIPKVRDDIFAVSKRLRAVLRLQYPTPIFLGFTPESDDRPIAAVPDEAKAAIWRRVVRSCVDTLRLPIYFVKPPKMPRMESVPNPTPLPQMNRYAPPGLPPEAPVDAVQPAPPS